MNFVRACLTVPPIYLFVAKLELVRKKLFQYETQVAMRPTKPALTGIIGIKTRRCTC